MRTFSRTRRSWVGGPPVHRSLILFLSLLILVNCSDDASSPEPSQRADETGFRKDGTLTFYHEDGSPAETIDIEIAETNEARQRGLMFRQEMRYDRGMLFIFEQSDPSGFWMKNTPLPLDIMFVDEDSTIINIARRTTPYSEENIYPEGPKRYVVEVRGGFSAMHGIEPGMTVRWTRDGASDNSASDNSASDNSASDDGAPNRTASDRTASDHTESDTK